MSTPDVTEAKIAATNEVTEWGETVTNNVFKTIGKLLGPDRLPRFVDWEMERRGYVWNSKTQKYESMFPTSLASK